MKSWVRVGAICECHGEGRGNLFEVLEIQLAANGNTCVYLREVAGSRHDNGWKNVKSCYRSAAAKLWESR